MRRLVVKSFRASAVIAKCERSALAHERVLRSHDLASITSAHRGWWQDGETFVLFVEDHDDEEPLGAIRLQRWGGRLPLPIELALGEVDARVHDWVASFADGGVGELCGLWCAPRARGFGLGSVLIRMGLSLATELGTRTVLGLCDTRHVALNRAFGFVHDPTLARQGSFEYPRPGLVAHVLRIADAILLSSATDVDRELTVGYRTAPIGIEVLQGPDRCVELVRDLRLPEARAPRNSSPIERPDAPASGAPRRRLPGVR